MKNDNKNIEEIPSEENDDYSDDSLFNISSWGADLSFRELLTMYDEDELLKPELQRKYVWDKTEASRFIDSILIGLPVPSIFLAKSGEQRLIIDGYQRIMTVHDYVRGIFSTDNNIFKLSNSEKINIRWRNKAFVELSKDEQRKIKNTTIHAIIFEQKHPKNTDTSFYQIFERINTSGKTLTAQEIRNCVYQGTLNTLLFELNKNNNWRNLFGLVEPDSRMRDIECILRFLLMKSVYIQKEAGTQISLNKELNIFMKNHKNSSPETISEFRKEFTAMVAKIHEKLGVKAFHSYSKGKFTKKFNPAIFDAISVAFHSALIEGNTIQIIQESNHIALLTNEKFKDATSVRTTNVENIKMRINLARKFLIDGITHE